MTERVIRLIEEARQLSLQERAELLHALSAMVDDDDEDIEAEALAECQHRWDDIGAESLGYIPGK